MAKRKPFQSIKLVYRRTPIYLKILILVMLIASTVALVSLHAVTARYAERSQQLQVQAAQLQQENEDLNSKIDALGTKDSIRRIATEILGLVDPNAKFFTPDK